MKKFFVILFLTFYMTSVSGVMFNYHYCGGKLASINLSFTGEGHACPCGSKKMKKNCCKDHNVQIKVKSEHKCHEKLTVSSGSFKFLPYQPVLFGELVSIQSFFSVFSFHDPPPKPNNSLLVLNSVFRI